MKAITFQQFRKSAHEPLFWFSGLWSILLFVPLVPVLPQVAGVNLFWRVELAASVLIGAILLLILWRRLFQNLIPHFHKYEIYFLLIPCIAFTAWSAISVFWATNQSAVMHHTLVWLLYVIFYCLIRKVVEQKNLLRFSLAFFIIIIWFIALPGVMEYFFVYNGNATTLGFRFSRYAEISNAAAPILLGLALYARKKVAFWILSSTVVLMWLLIIISLSRGSLLLSITGSVLFAAWCFLFKCSSQIKKRMICFLLMFGFVIIFSQIISSLTGKITAYDRAVSNETSESTSVRPFFAGIALEMLKDKPLQGVGADNYGLRFNHYREYYALANPLEPNLNTAESEIAERAHNEYLQILSELGLPGGFFFACFLFGINFLFIKAFKRANKLSPVTVGALIGILLFLASSLISSYSFRLLQNGLVFFFVLSIVAKDLYSVDKLNKKETLQFSPRFAIAFSVIGLILCFSLGTHSFIRAASQYYVEEARKQESIEEADFYYHKAKTLDTGNGSAYYYNGVQFLLAGRPQEAVPQLHEAIAKGITMTSAYSYLATAQTLAGDINSAETTMAEAVRIYPRSVFARMRYAVLLERNGKHEEAENQKNFALNLNPAQARSWFLLITEGARTNTLKAFNNEEYVTSMDLKPTNALYAVLDERGLVNPKEKILINFGN